MTSTIEDRAREAAEKMTHTRSSFHKEQVAIYAEALTTFAKAEVEKAMEEAYRLGHERIDRLRERMARTGYRVGLSDICAVLSHIRALKEGDKP